MRQPTQFIHIGHYRLQRIPVKYDKQTYNERGGY